MISTTRTPGGVLKKYQLKEHHESDKEDDWRTVVLVAYRTVVLVAYRTVVLVAYHTTDRCLVFKNSSGKNWANGGKFRVRDASVLPKLRFYEVRND